MFVPSKWCGGLTVIEPAIEQLQDDSGVAEVYQTSPQVCVVEGSLSCSKLHLFSGVDSKVALLSMPMVCSWLNL